MASYWTRTTADNTIKQNGMPEVTTTSFTINTLTPGNVAAQQGLVGALSTAIQGITLGAVQTTQLVYDRTEVSTSAAASRLAQRENKWLCRYHDAVDGTRYQLSVGTADLSKLPDHSEFLDLGAGDGAAFKTAFEAVVVAPNNPAHSVVLDTVQFVGRNS